MDFIFFAQEPVYGINVFEQILDSRGVVLFVLLLLIAQSLFSWFIIAYKYFYFKRLRQETEKFMDVFWKSDRLESIYEYAETLNYCSNAKAFKAGFSELTRVKNLPQKNRGTNPGAEPQSSSYGFENIERALRRAQAAEATRLERLVPFLATTGSSAPFIGLFGTVWGIMKAFAYIHPNKPILETVTPHIAQALVATAIGLFAAIPAVMAYNFFTARIRVFSIEMENFSIDFLNILKRHFF